MNRPLISGKGIVKPSSIHGYGVFALQDIEPLEVIEEAHTIAIKDKSLSLANYYYFSIEGDCPLAPLGSGMIYNHADEPNAYYEYHGDASIMVYAASKKILKGEEILVNYGPKWFSGRRAKTTQATWRYRFRRFLPQHNAFTRFLLVTCGLYGLLWAANNII